MQVSREESSRIYKSFRAFYQKFPLYDVRANDSIFLDAAEQDGGSEVLTAEWLELVLDSLRGRLVVLSQTAAQTANDAIENWAKQNPGYDCIANRQAIAERLSQQQEHMNTDSVAQAFNELHQSLAFNSEIYEEHVQQQLAAEREQLIDLLARNHSLSPLAQDQYRNTTLKRASIEDLRQMGRNYELRKRFNSMSDKDLKQEARQDADRRRAALQPSLPSEITAQAIRAASSRQIYEWQQRYGNELLNARLAGRG
jgi:hypothetical protein